MYFQEFQAVPLLYVIYEDLILDLLDRLVPNTVHSLPHVADQGDYNIPNPPALSYYLKNVRCHAYETLTVRCDSLNMGRIN